MGQLIRHKRATSRNIVRQLAVVTLSEQEQEDLKPRLKIILKKTDVLTSLNILADLSASLVCSATNVLQERRKLYRYYLRQVRFAARTNQLEIELEQQLFVERAEREEHANREHLKRAQENSSRDTLADQAAKAAKSES